LLLTFFFRQMRELIERGYLYIAQPPLYRAKKGNDGVYLKDDRGLDDYLFSAAIRDGAVFTTYEGVQHAGDDLRSMLDIARSIKTMIARLSQHVPTQIIEQAAISSALNPEILGDPDKSIQTAEYIAKRLNRLEGAEQRGWIGKPIADGGLEFSRTLRGVAEAHVIGGALIRSADAHKLNDNAAALFEAYGEHGNLVVKDQEFVITGPISLVDTMMTLGRKGISIQRYKGLGEMNPDQLWETTLDPNARTLLQVKIGHAEEAGKVFATLMGDVVEPRREFIQSNALKVVNLDV
jgi:DNA gyrase subunit B